MWLSVLLFDWLVYCIHSLKQSIIVKIHLGLWNCSSIHILSAFYLQSLSIIRSQLLFLTNFPNNIQLTLNYIISDMVDLVGRLNPNYLSIKVLYSGPWNWLVKYLRISNILKQYHNLPSIIQTLNWRRNHG